MELSLVPLLHVARSVYDVPRGPGRFEHYIRLMKAGADDDLFPLVALNPMAREYVSETLDRLIRMDAEGIASDALSEALPRLTHIEGSYRLGLVLADDRGGGWTNRQYTEMANRFSPRTGLKRGWVTTLLWSSETPDPETVRRETLAAAYRTAHFLRHGKPTTLRSMMTQEGRAAAFAGMEPGIDEEELAYDRSTIDPVRDSDDLPVQFAALYGDEAAKAVGYTPLGLSARAGFEVALAEGRETGWAVGLENP